MTFGPTYPKIDTVFKRDAARRFIIIPGDYSTPEFEYLADTPWGWTEKVDGTNIRLHWDGSEVTIGGRTDNAQVPSPLVANLRPLLPEGRGHCRQARLRGGSPRRTLDAHGSVRNRASRQGGVGMERGAHRGAGRSSSRRPVQP